MKGLPPCVACGQHLARHCQTLGTIQSRHCGAIVAESSAGMAPGSSPPISRARPELPKVVLDQGAMSRLDPILAICHSESLFVAIKLQNSTSDSSSFGTMLLNREATAYMA